MADTNRMEKVDMGKEFQKMPEADQYFIKKLETINRNRAQKIKALRMRNRLTIGAFAAVCFATCILFHSFYNFNFKELPKVVADDAICLFSCVLLFNLLPSISDNLHILIYFDRILPLSR